MFVNAVFVIAGLMANSQIVSSVEFTICTLGGESIASGSNIGKEEME